MIIDKPVYKYAETLDYSEEDIYSIWLASIAGMKAIWGMELIREYGSPKAVFENCGNFSEAQITKRQYDESQDESYKSERINIPITIRHQLKLKRDKAYIDSLIAGLAQKKIFAVPYGHPYYPELLAEIEDPPLVLFVRGNLNLNQERLISIVGTRKYTPYGKDIALKLAESLSITGVTVVSGLALVIDAFANAGALNGKTPTFAILGCGPDIIYPTENTWLYNRIISRGGSIVSEYLPGTTIAKWRFPVRNRIMSGMCQGVVIVEAPEKSGVIHTINAAFAQGREVFAVPGNVMVQQSNLPNKLISEGGRSVLSAWDIIEEFGWGMRPSQNSAKPSASARPGQAHASPRNLTIGENTVESEGHKSYDMSGIEARREELCSDIIKNLDKILEGHDNQDDKKLIISCIKSQELSQNEIAQATGLSVFRVNSYLTMLELESIIEQVQSGNYRLCI